MGFSTHAPLEVIVCGIETGLFDFVNLHYYYFDQRNLAPLQMAQVNDMGVFIIPQVLRLLKLWKCHDMKGYARYRYKIFEQKDHWVPGFLPTNENIARIDTAKHPLKRDVCRNTPRTFCSEYKLTNN